MCTVTLIARRSGYVLGMNRDEKLARPAGLKPARLRLDGRMTLAPSEPRGGTWIGVNDAGVTFALVNWYSVPDRVSGPAVSRGDLVKSVLPWDAPGPVDSKLDNRELGRVKPFRLIGVFPAVGAVVEWRWNLRRLERLDHPWQTNIWISSGFDEPGAQETRGRRFAAALGGTAPLTADWLRRLHRSHGPARGPYSLCMHREDAATVSFTEVVVSGDVARMRYTAGAPCCTAPGEFLDLRLRD
jgi:hypothetical protein